MGGEGMARALGFGKEYVFDTGAPLRGRGAPLVIFEAPADKYMHPLCVGCAPLVNVMI